MYPVPFEYMAPGTVEGAVDSLADAWRSGREALVLAGGHSLLPELKSGARTPDLLVGIGSIDAIRGVTVEGSTVVVGATTPYADARRHEAVTDGLAPLADALDVVGDRQVRNRGTVGGNLAQSEAGTDLPAPVLTLDGRLAVRSPDGERTLALESFYEDGGTLRPDELVTRVEMDVLGPDHGGAYTKYAHPHTGYPLVGVAAVVALDDRTVTDARVAATGATNAVPAVQLGATETAIEGTTPGLASGEAVADAAARASEAAATDTFPRDAAVSASYREHLLEVVTGRALERAVQRAAGSPEVEP